MRYISTRGATEPMRFSEAVLAGLAPDGGLLLPVTIPAIKDKLPNWQNLGFVDLAFVVMSEFIDDIDSDALKALIQRSYSSFDSNEITPIKSLDELHVLELFHGPTLAFKDIALQFLGNLFELLLQKNHQHMNILGATSGDTGSAAIAGVKGKQNINIFVMYPEGKPSLLQELQMTTVVDDNVHCIAVNGSFDDCQSMMKAVFNDLDFKQGYNLGAVNSVNWARVLAQIVYYAYASLKMCKGANATVSFSVPTGNFGDILAGYIAKRMGFPIEKLMLASNENDILPIFFNTGVYRKGEVQFTLSPSMDIQVASNFERYLFLKLNGDAAAVCKFMEKFESTGEARLAGEFAQEHDIQAVSIGTQETLDTIAGVQRSFNYVLDPHTAVGVAASKLIAGDGTIVCLATAHPAKFPDAIKVALATQTEDVMPDMLHHPRLDELEKLNAKSVKMEADINVLKQYITANAITVAGA